MDRMIRWKKSIPAVLAAISLAAGTMGAYTVTAWAVPASGTALSEGVRVRESAVTGDMVGSLSEGQEVTIEDETTGSDGMTWYQITYEVNGQQREGWVRSDLLDVSETDAESDAGAEEEAETSYVVASSIPSEVIPDGFEETTVTYSDGEVPALYSETLDLCLVYAADAEDETDADLFIYDEQNESLTVFVQFELQNGFVILLDIPEDERQLVSDRFALTECTFDHGSIPSYQLSEPDALVADDASIVDYYYMYGVNEIGETGWYLYNAEEGSIQKNVTSMQYSPVSAEEDTAADTDETADMSFALDSVARMVVGILAVVCLLLIVLAIIFSVRYRRLRNILEEEAGNESEAEPVPEPNSSRPSGERRKNTEMPSGKDKRSVQDKEESSQKENRLKKDTQKPASKERTKAENEEPQPAGRAVKNEEPQPAGREAQNEEPQPAGREAKIEEPQPAGREVKNEESQPVRRAAKKSGDEVRENQTRRKTEPVSFHLASDDVDVMDLDSMEDEDYEALLNKYLDENFSDEDEKKEHFDYDTPEYKLPEAPESEQDISVSGENPMRESASEAAGEVTAAKGTSREAVPESRQAASETAQEDFDDFLDDDDYDMPELLKADPEAENFDGMDLDLSIFDWPEKETAEDCEEDYEADLTKNSSLPPKRK